MIRVVARKSRTLPMFLSPGMVNYCLIIFIGCFQENLSPKLDEVERVR